MKHFKTKEELEITVQELIEHCPKIEVYLLEDVNYTTLYGTPHVGKWHTIYGVGILPKNFYYLEKRIRKEIEDEISRSTK